MIKILLDNIEINKVSRLMIHKTVHFDADYFEFEIPNSADEFTDLFYGTSGEKIEIGILPPSAQNQKPTTVFRGFCDTCDFSYIPQKTILVKGRDYTGFLIDEIISQELAAKLSGKTASQIVNIIANHYQYQSQVKATSNVYYDEKLYSEGTSVWSVITELATKEGYDAFCTSDKKIVFQPRILSEDIKRVYSLNSQYGQIPSNLEFAQDKTLSLALKVEVIGYDPKAKRKIHYLAESPLRNRPNFKIITHKDFNLKTKDQVRLLAETLLKEYSKDLIIGSLIIPVDPEIEPSDCIQIKAVKMAGNYYVTDVTHEYSVAGFTTRIDFSSKALTEARTVEQL
uniref:Phage late control D family protein n=1 Tax=candidate division WOR-3 bacterium TaxID=2052148 RepID=A0A7C6EEL1_UNCW3